MMLALSSWLAVAAGVPTGSVHIAAASGGAPRSITALPSGSSDEFRRRMLGWNAPAQAAPLRIRNETGTSRTRLDRLSITSRFGWRTDPISGVGRHHAGIDLPSRYGAAVMATAPGIVRV